MASHILSISEIKATEKKTIQYRNHSKELLAWHRKIYIQGEEGDGTECAVLSQLWAWLFQK
jgi:hypothetical protein